MSVETMTFGIEFETTVPRGSFIPGSYRLGRRVPGLPTGWVAKPDVSIQPPPDHVGVEFVSPVLSGADGLRQIIEALDVIRAAGAKVNTSTGLHIHVGFDRRETKTLARLVTLTANFEKAIYASTGARSREGNRYSNSTHQIGNVRSAIDQPDRYRVINLTNLRSGRKPTVEFRAFAGTLNAQKAIGYVRMCLGLVERAHRAKRITQWTAGAVKDSSPIKRNGDGQTTLTRLFYQLGWIAGRQSHVHGNLTSNDLPSLKDSKRILMKMARKFDRGSIQPVHSSAPPRDFAPSLEELEARRDREARRVLGLDSARREWDEASPVH